MFPNAKEDRKQLLGDDVKIDVLQLSNYSSEVSGNTIHTKNIISAIKYLKQKFLIKKPDFIIGGGMSGCGIGSIISYVCDIPLVVLKNNGTTREGTLDGNKIVRPNKEIKQGSVSKFWFVDDLIESGLTFLRCMEAASYYCDDNAECVGIILATGSANDLLENVQTIISKYLNANSFILSKNHDDLQLMDVLFGDGRQECFTI